jgi:predicted lipoprotein with Yx(FWY)xxD motif
VPDRRLLIRLAGAALTGCAVLAACNGPGTTAAVPSASAPPANSRVVVVHALSIAGLGEILVTSAGQTLYAHEPDHHHAVTCLPAGGCALAWPPLLLRPGAHLVAGTGVRAALLGTDLSGPAGGSVVTYDGWPLYTYVGDTGPGQARGQDQAYLWYVMSADGHPLTHPIAAG